MEQLAFDSELKKVYIQIEKAELAVLATSSQNKPTIRTMCIVFFDEKIYFQTSTEYVKYKQICENKNVALCIGNIQIEGIAEIKGRSIEHKKFVEYYGKNHENSYKNYSGLETTILIEVTPIRITQWVYDDDKPSRIFLELKTKSAYKIMEPYC